MLYLNVMCPLNEVHRFIDEAHESSLRVGDLFALLSEPVDRSFKPAEPREPGLRRGRPRPRDRGPRGDVPDGLRQAQAGAPRRLDDHPARRDDRRGRPVRMRQDHVAACLMRLVHPTGGTALDRRGPARVHLPRGDRPARRLRRPESLRLRRHDRGQHRLRLRRGDSRADPRGRRDGVHSRRDHDDARRLQGPRRGAGPEPLRRPAAADRPGADLPQESADPDPRRGDLGPGQHQRTDRPAGHRTRPGATAR